MTLELEENCMYTIDGIPSELGNALKFKKLYYQHCVFKGIKFIGTHSNFLYEKENMDTKPVYVFDYMIINPCTLNYLKNQDGTFYTTLLVFKIDDVFMNYTFTLHD